MNYLEKPLAERPSLEERERITGKIEARCPLCNQWRPGFCIHEHDGGWACDGCITRERRET